MRIGRRITSEDRESERKKGTRACLALGWGRRTLNWKRSLRQLALFVASRLSVTKVKVLNTSELSGPAGSRDSFVCPVRHGDFWEFSDLSNEY